MTDIKHDLVKVRDDLHLLDIEDTDELFQHQENLKVRYMSALYV